MNQEQKVELIQLIDSLFDEWGSDREMIIQEYCVFDHEIKESREEYQDKLSKWESLKKEISEGD